MAVVQGLEIRAGGIWQGVTQHIYDAEWVQGVNVSDQLTFTVPTSEVDEFLVIGAQVYLRRGDDADLHRIFVIEEIEVRYGERQETTFTAYDLLHWLGKVTLPVDYPPDPWGNGYEPKVHQTNFPKNAPKPPRTIRAASYVSGLLSYQSYVTFGGMGSSFDIDLEYEDVFVEAGTTLLDALHRLRDKIGGMIHVRDGGGLYWYSKRWINSPPECVLDTDNIISYTKRTDASGTETQYSYDIDVADLSQIDKTQSGIIAVGARLTFGTESLWITDIRQKLDAPIRARISGSSTLDATGRSQDLTEYLNDLAARSASNAHRIELLGQHVDQGLQYDPDGAGATDGPYPYEDERYITDVSEGVKNEGETNEVLGYVGTRNEVARADHRHYVRYGVDEEVTWVYGTERNNGMRDAVARADHTHPVSYGQASDIQAATGTTAAAGSNDAIARIDHQHPLDYGTASDIQPVGETAAAGTSDKVARADHVHVGASGGGEDPITEIPYGTAVQSTGAANYAGTSDDVARVDHVHRVTFGTNIRSVGTSNSAGTASYPARADHVHKGLESDSTNLFKVSELSNDGNKIKGYLWSSLADGWDSGMSEVYKPYVLQEASWNEKLLHYCDGTQMSYTRLTKYSREAMDYYGNKEIQFITPMYYINEVLMVQKSPSNGEWVDMNNAGRSWAACEED